MDWHSDWITWLGIVITVYFVLDGLSVIKSKLTKIEVHLATLSNTVANRNSDR